jgi:hypothetical protein
MASQGGGIQTVVVDEASTCAICLGIPLGSPRPLSCGHIFCPYCLAKHVQAQQKARHSTPSCPLCRSTLDKDEGKIPPPPVCAGCELGNLRLRDFELGDDQHTCNVCTMPIKKAERWLRCIFCDWDVCNACCSRLGPSGIAAAQQEYARNRSKRGKTRGLWFRAMKGAAALAHRRRHGSSSGGGSLKATASSATQGTDEVVDDGAAYNVYVQYDRSKQHDGELWSKERLKHYYRASKPSRPPIHYIGVELPQSLSSMRRR